MNEKAPKTTTSLNAVATVLLIVAVGLIAGVVLFAAEPSVVPPSLPQCPPGPGCPMSAPSSGFGYVQAAVILSTLAMALLAALFVVYARTYRETRAPFILGLLFFLLALLLETVLTSPFVFTGLGLPPGRLAPYLTFGQLFMDAALAIFLYLSLQ